MLPLLKDKVREPTLDSDYSLQQIPDRPNCTYKSGHIVWLSSLDWCNFVQRRVREFYNFQERLSRFVDTPKYGSVMWILTHIIQHDGIVPIIKNNLFKDMPALLRCMSIFPGPKPKVKLPGLTLLPSEDCITWKQLEIFVNLQNPKAMVREFVWDPIWSTYFVAHPLFCQFTFEY